MDVLIDCRHLLPESTAQSVPTCARQTRRREAVSELHGTGLGKAISSERDLGILTFVIGTLMHVDICAVSLQDIEPWI